MTLEELTAEVEALRTRVSGLEGRIRTLESQQSSAPAAASSPAASSTPGSPPPAAAPGAATGPPAADPHATPPAAAAPAVKPGEDGGGGPTSVAPPADSQQAALTAHGVQLPPAVPGTAPTPTLPAENTVNVPQLTDPPANGKPPSYPPLGDVGKHPGFKNITAGSEYKWIGADSASVIVGDKRDIIQGENVTHVGGTRTTQIGGLVKVTNYSGTETETFGHVKVTINGGPQTLDLHGDQVVVIDGTRNVTSKGHRKELNLAGREETWHGVKKEEGHGFKNELQYGPKNEVVFAEKGEVVMGAKMTAIVGMKFETVQGITVNLGKSPAKVIAPKYGNIIGGGIDWIASGIAKMRGSKIEQKSSKHTIDAPSTVITGNVHIKGKLFVDKDAYVVGTVHSGDQRNLIAKD